MKPAARFELPMRRPAGSGQALRDAPQLCTLNADALMMDMADITIPPMTQKTESV